MLLAGEKANKHHAGLRHDALIKVLLVIVFVSLLGEVQREGR